MELLSPEYGLLFWTSLSFVSLVLSIVAIIAILRNNKIGGVERLGWIVIVFLIPFIGSIVYFNRNKSRNSNKYV